MPREELWLEQKNHVSVEQVTDPCIPHFTKQLRSEKTPHFLQNSSELKIQSAIKKKSWENLLSHLETKDCCKQRVPYSFQDYFSTAITLTSKGATDHIFIMKSYIKLKSLYISSFLFFFKTIESSN